MTRPVVVQAHLVESPTRPLHQMYKVLHSLCQSLQLEVLYTQTMKLISERLGDHVRVEEYMPGVCLTVSYWRDLLIPPGRGSKRALKFLSASLFICLKGDTQLAIGHIIG